MAKSPRTKTGPNNASSHHVQSTQQTVVARQQWSGPLPDPQSLKQFDEIVPKGAERIFKMTESEQAHRMVLEKQGLHASIAEAKRGQWLGASISIIAIFGALMSVYLKAHWGVTGLLVGVPIMGLAKAIVDSRSKKES